jgi:neuropeptide F receptor
MEILSNSWPLGESAISCKMVGSLQAVSIFVSTMSITAIALDRYQLIVYPTQASCQRAGALAVLGAIWLISAVLAAPLFIWRTLEHHDIPYPNSPIQSVDYCFENWPGQGRAWYSAACIVIQYALPIVTVSIAHVRIYYKLRYRLTSMTSTFKDPNKQIREDLRLRKTNQLLIAIAIIFGICWMPLNIFNVVVDSSNVFGDDTEAMFVIYGICHM